MRNLNLLLCCFLLQLLPSVSMAVRYVGNGGHGVSCQGHEGKSRYSLLDFFEADILEPGQSRTHWRAENMDAIIADILQRLAQHDPERSSQYAVMTQKLQDPRKFIRSPLVKTEDSLSFTLPQECRLEQLAIRLSEEADGYGLGWVFDKNLYEKLSSTDQAGLLFHEAVYDELIELGVTNSVRVRYFIAKLFSDDFPSYDLQDYILLLRKTGFKTLHYMSFNLSVRNHRGNPFEMTFHRNGKISSAYLDGPEELPLYSGIIIQIENQIHFYPDGQVRRASPRSLFNLGGRHPYRLSEIDLNEKAQITGGLLSSAANLPVKNRGLVSIPANSYLKLDENMNIIYFLPEGRP